MSCKEQHAEYMRKYRATVKALHICPRCGDSGAEGQRQRDLGDHTAVLPVRHGIDDKVIVINKSRNGYFDQ